MNREKLFLIEGRNLGHLVEYLVEKQLSLSTFNMYVGIGEGSMVVFDDTTLVMLFNRDSGIISGIFDAVKITAVPKLSLYSIKSNTFNTI